MMENLGSISFWNPHLTLLKRESLYSAEEVHFEEEEDIPSIPNASS